jgi:hypothetical protein
MELNVVHFLFVEENVCTICNLLNVCDNESKFYYKDNES